MAAPETVGLSNSQLALKSERSRNSRSISSPRVTEFGIDTWRVARYLDSERDLRVARSFFGGVVGKVGEHSAGVIAGPRLMWLEGHPSCEGLAAPADLADHEQQLLQAVSDLGLPVGRDAGLRRLDSTVTLQYEQPGQGLAFLRGMAAVDMPRLKTAVYKGTDAKPQTVYFLGPGRSRRKLARVYDKGVESGRGRPGEFVRLETQTRISKDAAEVVTPAVMARHHQLVGSYFKDRFTPVALSVDGVHVATASVLADRVAELVSEERLSPGAGARLLGFLVAGDRLDVPASTARRWRAELRKLGLILADPMSDELDIDLGEALEVALASWEGSDCGAR